MSRRHSRVLLLAAAALAIAPSLFLAQQVTFKSGVDLIAVDTQVVDREGQPIADLTAGNFEVYVNGQARKVVSADLIQYPLDSPRSLILPAIETPDVMQRSDLPEVKGRVIVLAVDEVSFNAAAMPMAVQAAKRFVTSLPAEDVIALYSYPFGAGRLDLTHFHNQVSLGLNRLQGYKQQRTGDINLSPSEAIDIAANDQGAINMVYSRECLVQVGSNCVDKDTQWGGGANNAGQVNPDGTTVSVKALTGGLGSVPRGESSCMINIKGQARDYVNYIEQMSAESFAGLQDLLQSLGRISGPKTVILLSAGIMSSDRIGGRPDAASVTAQAGKLAAAANATLYTLHMDGSFLEINSAAGHQQAYNSCQSGVSGGLTSNGRDGDLAAYGLQRMASSAGGQYFRVTAGSGDNYFNRVLKETSAYYVLGVQPEPADRDGRAHFIRVKTVDVKNATLHFRTQVTIPKQ
jgi:VWFA-related protein